MKCVMKCRKCRKRNITKANYCLCCGNPFSERDQKLARRKTLVGKLEWLEDTYNKWTLKTFFDKLLEKKPLKVLYFILLILINVAIFAYQNKDFKLLEGEQYEIKYNNENKNYYVLTGSDSTPINVYLPKQLDNLEIKELDENNNTLRKVDYEIGKELVLDVSKNNYYLMDIGYKNGKKEEVKVYVYRVE